MGRRHPTDVQTGGVKPIHASTSEDTDTIVAPAMPSMEEGDHERMAHIVFPKEKLTEAVVMGTPVIALCGKVWTPSRDPERFPVCAGCIESFESLTGRAWPGRR